MNSWPRIRLNLLSAAVVVMVLLAHAEFRGHYDWHDSERLQWAVIYILFCWLSFYAFGIPDLPRSRQMILDRCFRAVAVSSILFALIQSIVGSALLPRMVVFGSMPLNMFVGYVVTYLSLKSDVDFARRTKVKILVADVQKVERQLSSVPPNQKLDLEIVSKAEGESICLDDSRLDVVVVDTEMLGRPEVIRSLGLAHARGVRVRTVVSFFEEWYDCLPVGSLEEISLLSDIGELHKATYARYKRAIELLLAAALIPVLLAVVPLVAVLNLMFNRGKLLYVQQRVGRGGKPFYIVKFRTMLSSNGNSEWTKAADSRVTALGRMLRKTHIDELPQIVNVLMGDLAFVGPRPEQTEYVDSLCEEIPFFAERHRVRPGITGWAQLHQSYASSVGESLTKLQYDLYYIRNQSLSLDLQIIVLTVKKMFTMSGR